jgi:hypothetical protein
LIGAVECIGFFWGDHHRSWFDRYVLCVCHGELARVDGQHLQTAATRTPPLTGKIPN